MSFIKDSPLKRLFNLLGAPISYKIAPIATVSVQERRVPSKKDPLKGYTSS